MWLKSNCRGIWVISLALTLVACSSTGEKSDKKVDYRSSQARSSLEVPPDLTSLDSKRSVALGTDATSYNALNTSGSADANAVLPEIEGVNLVSSGSERWLEVNSPADVVWKSIQQFWANEQINLDLDNPAAGVMETEWLENMNQYGSRVEKAWRKFFGGVESLGNRDKYRVRLERGAATDTTLVYLTHRRLDQQIVAPSNPNVNARTYWKEGQSIPELEIEMLRLLMLFLGVDEEEAKTIASAAEVEEVQSRAALMTTDDGQFVLELYDGFSRAWRRTGLALDRVGFTVEDQDRTAGVYFVRSFDPAEIKKEKEKGFFRKLFSRKKGGVREIQTKLLVAEQSAQLTRVSVLDEDEKTTADLARHILELLHEQLK